jgi:hypothetical protein
VKIFFVLLIVSGTIGAGLSYGIQPDYTVATIEWNEFSFSGFEGTKANVTVVDPDMNKYPNAIDYLWASIHSDSDPDLNGTRMTLFETGFDSGIFKREITFVETPPSGGGFLHVVTGDTISAKYVDKMYPANFTSDDPRRVTITDEGLEVTATSIIVGKRGPPLERAPASNMRLLSLSKEPIIDNTIVVDQQIRVVSDLENQQNRTQPFAYLVQIQNSQNKIESLSWLAGNLTSFQKFSPDVTWIPFEEGMYTATAFVWESVYNPTALSPPINIEIIVKKADL